jgi:arylsulfatase
MYYWTSAELHAVRSGPWKLHVKKRDPVNYDRFVVPDKPELYHVERDISEAYNVADQHLEIVERLLAMIKAHEADIEPHEDMLAIPLTK